MFVLNPGRYVVGDPGIILDGPTFKELWGSTSRFDSLELKTDAGLIIAPSTGKNGEFKTSLGRNITTATTHIAFVPYRAVGRLLPYEVLRLSLAAPAMLYFSACAHIVLDGKLTIYCGAMPG